MFYVYILYSQKDKNLYVGKTDNLSRRLERHNKGLIKSTKHRRPLKLVYREIFRSPKEAYLRERELKLPSAGKFKKELRQKLKLNNNPG